jgi:hypothetical protein
MIAPTLTAIVLCILTFHTLFAQKPNRTTKSLVRPGAAGRILVRVSLGVVIKSFVHAGAATHLGGGAGRHQDINVVTDLRQTLQAEGMTCRAVVRGVAISAGAQRALVQIKGLADSFLGGKSRLRGRERAENGEAESDDENFAHCRFLIVLVVVRTAMHRGER